MDEKVCRCCNKSKKLDEFSSSPLSPDGTFKDCKTCFKAKLLKRRHNLSDSQFIEFSRIIEEGVCPKCSKVPKRWMVLNQDQCLSLCCSSCVRADKFKPEIEARIIGGKKRCYVCKSDKPLDDFHVDNTRPDGRSYSCRECYNTRAKEVYDSELEKERHKKKYRRNVEKDPLFAKKCNLKRRWGLTWDQFTKLFAAQGNSCKICKTTERPHSGWVIDHDHTCCPTKGKSCGRCIRGILCQNCNHGLGRFMDNPELLQAAINYLNEHKTNGGVL